LPAASLSGPTGAFYAQRMADDSGVDSNGVPYRTRGLRSLTDDELENAIRRSDHSIGGGEIVEEAGRRRADRQARLLIRLTWAVLILTGFIVALTIAVVALTSAILSRTAA
jgi:hypothetical protein